MGQSITGSVADIHYRVSRIPEAGLEIPIMTHFSIAKKATINKMQDFVEKHLQSWT